MRWDTLIIWGLNFAIKNPIPALVIAAAVSIFISVNSQPAYVYKPQPPTPPPTPFDMTALAIENIEIRPVEPCCTWKYGVSHASIDLDITNNGAKELYTFGVHVTVRDCDQSNKCVKVGEADTKGMNRPDIVAIRPGWKRHATWNIYFFDMPKLPDNSSRFIDREFYAGGP